jgi:DNA-binding transcriptional MerR regulator
MGINNIKTLHCRTRVLGVCYNVKCNLVDQRGRYSMKNYSTSEIAKMMGIHPNTVMLYEKWGYIAYAPRKTNGYRVYTETHLEQIKLVRLALGSELIKCYMKFEVQNIIRSAAQGDLRRALEHCCEYLTHIQKEKNNELKVMKVIQEILNSDSPEEKNLPLNRNGAAKLLGISINVIVYWERNGLLEVPRSKNGYRIYGEYEIKQLRVIKALRQENYSTQCICSMLERLKTKGNDVFLSRETEALDDWFLSSLPEVERNTRELIDYIGELISKKQND